MTTSASPQDLETARLLLNRLGVDPAELLTAGPSPEDGSSRRKPMPTIREWIPVVAALLSPSTAASYGSYWAKAEAAWGDRPMDTITATEIKAQSEIARATAVVRRNSRGGRNAAENFIAAVRCLYKHLETTVGSISTEIPPAESPNHGATPPPASPCPTPNYPNSTTSSPAPATTPNSTPSSAACTRKPPAAAAAPSRSGRGTSTAGNAPSGSGRRVKPNAGNLSPPH